MSHNKYSEREQQGKRYRYQNRDNFEWKKDKHHKNNYNQASNQKKKHFNNDEDDQYGSGNWHTYNDIQDNKFHKKDQKYKEKFEGKQKSDAEVEDSIKNLKDQIKLYLTPDFPTREYRVRKWEEKKLVRHWGQRKLFFTELLFLMDYGHLSKNVLYAGAAPGTHIEYLSYLFEGHSFVLVDPNPFEAKESDKIKIINGYFTDELAQQYAGKDYLFISDIRTADSRQMEKLEHETYVQKDTESQLKWVQLMKPKRSMIKFRCPYPDVCPGTTDILKGDIMIQVWAPPSSTETRLIIGEEFQWEKIDNQTYEKQLFYHNDEERRNKQYDQPIKGEGLDESWDAAAEVLILYQFLVKFPQYRKGKNLYSSIRQLSYEITSKIGKGQRKLQHYNRPKDERRQFPLVNHIEKFYKDNHEENQDTKPSNYESKEPENQIPEQKEL